MMLQLRVSHGDERLSIEQQLYYQPQLCQSPPPLTASSSTASTSSHSSGSASYPNSPCDYQPHHCHSLPSSPFASSLTRMAEQRMIKATESPPKEAAEDGLIAVKTEANLPPAACLVPPRMTSSASTASDNSCMASPPSSFIDYLSRELESFPLPWRTEVVDYQRMKKQLEKLHSIQQQQAASQKTGQSLSTREASDKAGEEARSLRRSFNLFEAVFTSESDKYSCFITAMTSENEEQLKQLQAAISSQQQQEKQTGAASEDSASSDSPSLSSTFTSILSELHVSIASLSPGHLSVVQSFFSIIRRLDLTKRFLVLNLVLLWRIIKHQETVMGATNSLSHAELLESSRDACRKVDHTWRSLFALMHRLGADVSKFPAADSDLCQMCQQVMVVPLQLSCAHSFCLSCLAGHPSFAAASSGSGTTPSSRAPASGDKVTAIGCPSCQSAHTDELLLQMDGMLQQLLAIQLTNSSPVESGSSKRRNSDASAAGSAATDEEFDHEEEADEEEVENASRLGKPKRWHGASCHQCKTAKDPSLLLFCTSAAEKGIRKRRCRKKYCQTQTTAATTRLPGCSRISADYVDWCFAVVPGDSCLRRSYNPNVAVGGSHWSCPSCQGICVCAACSRSNAEQTKEEIIGGIVALASLNPMVLASLGVDTNKVAELAELQAMVAEAGGNSQTLSLQQPPESEISSQAAYVANDPSAAMKLHLQQAHQFQQQFIRANNFAHREMMEAQSSMTQERYPPMPHGNMSTSSSPLMRPTLQAGQIPQLTGMPLSPLLAASASAAASPADLALQGSPPTSRRSSEMAAASRSQMSPAVMNGQRFSSTSSFPASSSAVHPAATAHSLSAPSSIRWLSESGQSYQRQQQLEQQGYSFPDRAFSLQSYEDQAGQEDDPAKELLVKRKRSYSTAVYSSLPPTASLGGSSKRQSRAHEQEHQEQLINAFQLHQQQLQQQQQQPKQQLYPREESQPDDSSAQWDYSSVNQQTLLSQAYYQQLQQSQSYQWHQSSSSPPHQPYASQQTKVELDKDAEMMRKANHDMAALEQTSLTSCAEGHDLQPPRYHSGSELAFQGYSHAPNDATGHSSMASSIPLSAVHRFY